MVANSTCQRILAYEEEYPEANTAEVADELGYSKSTIYNCHWKRNKVQESSEEDLSDIVGEDDAALWNAFKEYQRETRRAQPHQEHTTAQLQPNGDGKAYLVGIGDLHLENVQTYSDKIERDLRTIRQQKGAGVVVPGDLTDSPVKYKDGSHHTVAATSDARKLAETALALIKHKILAMSSGCHERHGEEQADYNHVADLAQRWDIPYLGFQGSLELQVGKQYYNIAVSHKGKGHSMYNDHHSGIRIIRESYPDAEIIITGHNHRAGHLDQAEQGQRKLVLSIGTYKQGDWYARSEGHTSGEANLNTPVVILDSKRHHFEVLSDISALN